MDMQYEYDDTFPSFFLEKSTADILVSLERVAGNNV